MLADLSISEAECADVTFITDAAANMVAAFRVSNRTVMKRITCACHMLNTCLQNAVNRKPNSHFRLDDEGVPILHLIQSCKALVTYCKQTYISGRLSIAPVQAVETRWNSNLDMLDSIIRLYPEFENVLQERNERNRLPGPVDFLRAVAELLRPFKQATLALESSSSPTIHLVVPYFIKIRTHVSQPISEEYRDLPQYGALVAYQVSSNSGLSALYIFKIIYKLFSALQKQLKKVCDAKLVVDELHKAAVFLNPAMKDLLMYPPAEQATIVKYVRERCGTTSSTSQPVAATADIGSSFAEFSQFCRYSDTGTSTNHTDE